MITVPKTGINVLKLGCAVCALKKKILYNINDNPSNGKIYPIINYGILNIEPNKNKITVSIHDKNGQELNSKTINIH